MQQNRIQIIKTEEEYTLLRKEGFEKIEQIPDNVDEIKSHSIAKPLLEYIKQRKLLKQMFLQNLNYIKPTIDEYNSLLEIDYNRDLDIVKVAKKLIELLERNIVCLNQAEEIAEKTLVEVYTIISKEKR